MTVVRPMPPVNLSAVTLNGMATVIFPSQPFARNINQIWVGAGINTGATIYRAQLQAASIITSIKLANPNTYNVPFSLPAGQTLYVVFDAAPNPVSLARAAIQATREWSR